MKCYKHCGEKRNEKQSKKNLKSAINSHAILMSLKKIHSNEGNRCDLIVIKIYI